MGGRGKRDVTCVCTIRCVFTAGVGATEDKV